MIIDCFTIVNMQEMGKAGDCLVGIQTVRMKQHDDGIPIKIK